MQGEGDDNCGWLRDERWHTSMHRISRDRLVSTPDAGNSVAAMKALVEDAVKTTYEQYVDVRRFTRLTNAFPKKFENYVASMSIHYVWYNFVRIHQTLRVTPAMAAGLATKLWAIEDLVSLLQ
jgi:hypothetical protein